MLSTNNEKTIANFLDIIHTFTFSNKIFLTTYPSILKLSAGVFLNSDSSVTLVLIYIRHYTGQVLAGVEKQIYKKCINFLF